MQNVLTKYFDWTNLCCTDFVVQFRRFFILENVRGFPVTENRNLRSSGRKSEMPTYRGWQLLSRPRERSARIITEHYASPEARAGAPPPDNERRLTKQIHDVKQLEAGNEPATTNSC